MSSTTASYLQIYLAPLIKKLEQWDVSDIYINQPGEIWVETLSGQTERHDAPEITEALLWQLARQMASISHQGISREHPLLAARLPDGARVQIVAPPATRGAMAIAIRKHVSSNMSLSDYDRNGAFAATRGTNQSNAVDVELRSLYEAASWAPFLRAAVRARKTIIVSGGTSSGKTTFVNALLQEIDSRERLILIEDTPELMLRHRNAVGLVAVRGALGEASVNTDDLLMASLRMRPDRIVLGELRGIEAFTFLRAVNTGHPGSLTTIHADSPDGAIEQLVLLALQSRVGLDRDATLAYLRKVVDVIVQLERTPSGRQVSQVAWTSFPGSRTSQ